MITEDSESVYDAHEYNKLKTFFTELEKLTSVVRNYNLFVEKCVRHSPVEYFLEDDRSVTDFLGISFLGEGKIRTS